MNITLSGNHYDITSPAAGAMRVRTADLAYGGLDRYHVVKLAEDAALPAFTCDNDQILLRDEAGRLLTTISVKHNASGWQIQATLREGEKLYGLGDINRTRLNRRGYRYRIWVVNVKSYMPIPFLMSSEGWAIAVNTTYEHFFDVGAAREDMLAITCRYAAPDFTLFTGKDLAELLCRYTSVTGRPLMLPRWAMGLTFVCNTQADAYQLVNDGLNFRREDIPCDILGLEPGWMETNYDETTEKKWHPERFYLPPYAPKGPHTFLGAVDRLKFKLSLWLCCNYDLTWFEEQQLKEAASAQTTFTAPTPSENDASDSEEAFVFEDDEHFHNSERRMDTVTKPEEGWFEHLKKFVDQGVSAFKLDGAYQVLDHPDRLYGNGMNDAEAHNLYPLLLSKQMSLGFAEHTGRRPMIYSASGYTGIQQYAATWAGDTGGGFGPLVSMLNNGLCGHSNTSCDMEIFSTASIHFGFLQPWSQVNSWNYWRHPWLLEEEDKEIFRSYDKLRYSLFPYLYTTAAQAYETGMPMMRALPLLYPKDERVGNLLHEYMLGDALLVGVFLEEAVRAENGVRTNLYLPEGTWYDFFTGQMYEGKQDIFYLPPKGKGGALFVKAGSAIPFVEPDKYIAEKVFDQITLRVWPDEAGCARGTLYEDDGITLDYINGACRKTTFRIQNGELSIEQTGSYEGMPEIEFTVATL